MLPIKVTPVADAHIQKAANWWLANREEAPEAFKEELARVFAHFAAAGIGRESNEFESERRPAHSSQSHSLFLVLPCQREPRRGSRFVAFKSIERSSIERAA